MAGRSSKSNQDNLEKTKTENIKTENTKTEKTAKKQKTQKQKTQKQKTQTQRNLGIATDDADNSDLITKSVKELDENIDEKVQTSAELKNFIQQNMKHSFFYDKEDEVGKFQLIGSSTREIYIKNQITEDILCILGTIY